MSRIIQQHFHVDVRLTRFEAPPASSRILDDAGSGRPSPGLNARAWVAANDSYRGRSPCSLRTRHSWRSVRTAGLAGRRLATAYKRPASHPCSALTPFPALLGRGGGRSLAIRGGTPPLPANAGNGYPASLAPLRPPPFGLLCRRSFFLRSAWASASGAPLFLID